MADKQQKIKMSSNAAKLQSNTEEGSDEAQHLRSKTDEGNSKNSSTSESGVDSKMGKEVFNQQHQSERLKREEAFQSEDDAEDNIIDNAQNQLQQQVGDLKFSLNTKDTQTTLADAKLCGKVAEKKELIAKQCVIVQEFRDELQEKNTKITNLLKHSVKLEKELKTALRFLITAKKASSTKHDVIKSMNARVHQLKHELMEVKEEIAHFEGQWRSFADYRDEMPSSDDRQNDHDEHLKQKLLIELKQAVTNKVRSSRDGPGTNIREPRKQQKDMQRAPSNQQEETLQNEILT